MLYVSFLQAPVHVQMQRLVQDGQSIEGYSMDCHGLIRNRKVSLVKDIRQIVLAHRPREGSMPGGCGKRIDHRWRMPFA